MARLPSCCSKSWNWVAWPWLPGAPCAALRPLILRLWLVWVIVLSGCQCGPTGRLTAIPAGLSEIPDFQLGITCQEKMK